MSLLLAQHSQRSSVVTFWSHPVYMSAVVVAASAGGGVTAQVLRRGRLGQHAVQSGVVPAAPPGGRLQLGLVAVYSHWVVPG